MKKGLAEKLFWWMPFGEVPEIEARELGRRCEGGQAPQLVDVRTVREWRKSRVPGARWASMGDLRHRPAALGLDPDRPVVAICLTAHRSIPAVRVLRRQGFKEVCQLKGGMRAWWGAGLPTEGGSAEREHD